MVEILEPTIDIKPRDPKNRVEIDDDEKVKVAILTSVTDDGIEFDATRVDPETVTFGRTGTEASPRRNRIVDVDRDGYADQLLKFKVKRTGLTCLDTDAALQGRTIDGVGFAARDQIMPVDCDDDDDDDDDDEEEDDDDEDDD